MNLKKLWMISILCCGWQNIMFAADQKEGIVLGAAIHLALGESVNDLCQSFAQLSLNVEESSSKNGLTVRNNQKPTGAQHRRESSGSNSLGFVRRSVPGRPRSQSFCVSPRNNVVLRDRTTDYHHHRSASPASSSSEDEDGRRSRSRSRDCQHPNSPKSP